MRTVNKTSRQENQQQTTHYDFPKSAHAVLLSDTNMVRRYLLHKGNRSLVARFADPNPARLEFADVGSACIRTQ